MCGDDKVIALQYEKVMVVEAQCFGWKPSVSCSRQLISIYMCENNVHLVIGKVTDSRRRWLGHDLGGGNGVKIVHGGTVASGHG